MDNFEIGDIVRLTKFPVWGKIVKITQGWVTPTTLIITVEIDNAGKPTDPFVYKHNDNTLAFDAVHWHRITEKERLLLNLKG